MFTAHDQLPNINFGFFTQTSLFSCERFWISDGNWKLSCLSCHIRTLVDQATVCVYRR